MAPGIQQTFSFVRPRLSSAMSLFSSSFDNQLNPIWPFFITMESKSRTVSSLEARLFRKRSFTSNALEQCPSAENLTLI
ncbi:hypothetical protein TNIN_389711 [Trichonephila inaurata madagascariensis]|uniref:Uncharacterized protein n=1 Tax=Trichonephila inaurata madagascariensis TaxID=2747483 RepID=A0A8X6X294_9ARAC|nr:hypothetical protein TNIN_389711 [Trichonephila inaurata madagascariensis]